MPYEEPFLRDHFQRVAGRPQKAMARTVLVSGGEERSWSFAASALWKFSYNEGGETAYRQVQRSTNDGRKRNGKELGRAVNKLLRLKMLCGKSE
jgi:hypothetical protein